MDESGILPYRPDLVANLAGIRASDARTVELVAKHPVAIFLNRTTALAPPHEADRTRNKTPLEDANGVLFDLSSPAID